MLQKVYKNTKKTTNIIVKSITFMAPLRVYDQNPNKCIEKNRVSVCLVNHLMCSVRYCLNKLYRYIIIYLLSNMDKKKWLSGEYQNII